MAEEMDKLGYNIFNLNDRFYKDMCTPYKSKIGTDIVLSDRVDYIYNNLDAQCQSNCKFVDYALDARYINCDCTVQEETINAIQAKKIDPLEPKSILHMFYFVFFIFNVFNSTYYPRNTSFKNNGQTYYCGQRQNNSFIFSS